MPSYPNSTLLLAGDVSDDLAIIEQTLRTLQCKFTNVFFTVYTLRTPRVSAAVHMPPHHTQVGNHELWLRGSAREQYTSFGTNGVPT